MSAPLPTHLSSMDRLDIATGFIRAMIRSGWDNTPVADVVGRAVELADALLVECGGAPVEEGSDPTILAGRAVHDFVELLLDRKEPLVIGGKHPKEPIREMAAEWLDAWLAEQLNAQGQETK
jgi:hypothetical protein